MMFFRSWFLLFSWGLLLVGFAGCVTFGDNLLNSMVLPSYRRFYNISSPVLLDFCRSINVISLKYQTLVNMQVLTMCSKTTKPMTKQTEPSFEGKNSLNDAKNKHAKRRKKQGHPRPIRTKQKHKQPQKKETHHKSKAMQLFSVFHVFIPKETVLPKTSREYH